MQKRVPRLTRPEKDKECPRMLVVDDDDELCRILRRAAHIAAPDLVVEIVTTADGAREMLDDSRYDVVLLDNFLDQGHRGIDLVRRVRKSQPSAVVAFMSSMESEALRALASAERNLPVLPKPLSPMSFRLFLRESLDLPLPYCGNLAPLV